MHACTMKIKHVSKPQKRKFDENVIQLFKVLLQILCTVTVPEFVVRSTGSGESF
jgi:hypothetical protein